MVQSVFGIHGDDEKDRSAGFIYLLAMSEALFAHVIEDLIPGHLSTMRRWSSASRRAAGVMESLTAYQQGS